jgi:hypothetical protein
MINKINKERLNYDGKIDKYRIPKESPKFWKQSDPSEALITTK